MPFEPGSWGQRFEYMEGLKDFELELETIQAKAEELNVIIRRAHTWKFRLGDGRILVLDEDATRKDTWTGSKHFKGLNAPSVPAGLQLRQGSTASFSGLGKKRTDSMSETEEELGPGDTLDYYLVTLFWRAQDQPKANAVLEEESHANASSVMGNPNAALASTTAPGTPPRISYNRGNAVPTFYG